MKETTAAAPGAAVPMRSIAPQSGRADARRVICSPAAAQYIKSSPDPNATARDILKAWKSPRTFKQYAPRRYGVIMEYIPGAWMRCKYIAITRRHCSKPFLMDILDGPPAFFYEKI